MNTMIRPVARTSAFRNQVEKLRPHLSADALRLLLHFRPRLKLLRISDGRVFEVQSVIAKTYPEDGGRPAVDQISILTRSAGLKVGLAIVFQRHFHDGQWRVNEGIDAPIPTAEGFKVAGHKSEFRFIEELH